MTDFETWAQVPCPACRHQRGRHHAGQPATMLLCDDCPDGICPVTAVDAASNAVRDAEARLAEAATRRKDG